MVAPVGLWPRHGRRASGNVALLSALAAFAVPAAFGVAQPLPAVPADATQPGLGHRGLLVGEPFRLGQGHQRVQMRESTPLLRLAYRDPRLLPAISPGRSREASPDLTSAAATTTRTTRIQDR